MIAVIFSTLLLLLPLSASGQGLRCDRPDLGSVTCQAGRMCECVFDRGGLATATPPGYRWDCGTLRPRCGDAAVPPASITEHRGAAPALPLAVGIDRSQRSINVGSD